MMVGRDFLTLESTPASFTNTPVAAECCCNAASLMLPEKTSGNLANTLPFLTTTFLMMTE